MDYEHKESEHYHVHSGGNHGDKLLTQGHKMTGDINAISNLEHAHMQMTFSLKTCTDFLLEGVHISTPKGIILAIVFTILLSILLDILKTMLHVRESHKDPAAPQRRYRTHFISTVYHMMSVTLAYLMMLCVMTMNIWLMIAVVLGSGIAHLFIRPLLLKKSGKRNGDSTHCSPDNRRVEEARQEEETTEMLKTERSSDRLIN